MRLVDDEQVELRPARNEVGRVEHHLLEAHDDDERVLVLIEMPVSSIAATLATCKTLAAMDECVLEGCVWQAAYERRWGGKCSSGEC